MKIDFAFIILHYKTVEDTIECVKSILESNSENKYVVIIVDNGSNDGSFQAIKRTFKHVYSIEVLTTGENIGFAKGNNFGCEYAINKYEPDFLCVINNDTLVLQTDFVEKVRNSYSKSNFHILGPNIKSVSEFKEQNPTKVYYTIIDIENQISKFRIMLFLSNIHLDRIYDQLLYYIPAGLRKIFRALIKQKKEKANDEKIFDQVPLHGSAIVFTKKYYKESQFIFYPGTFLYCEEAFILYNAVKNGYSMIYDPTIEILHKEDVTTKLINKSRMKQKKFIYSHLLDSYKLLYEYIYKNGPI